MTNTTHLSILVVPYLQISMSGSHHFLQLLPFSPNLMCAVWHSSTSLCMLEMLCCELHMDRFFSSMISTFEVSKEAARQHYEDRFCLPLSCMYI